MQQQENRFGQKHIWMPFLAALQAERLAHAYLVYGPTGSGVMDVVQAMAKAILCPEVPGGFCDACDVCRRVEHRSYPDLHVIEARGLKITLDQARGVLDLAYQYPMEGRYRVFLIDGPEKMNVETANMLLKVLEEPPSQTHFLLGSENCAGILPTVISRCQGFRLRPLPEQEIQRRLQDECGLEPEQALAIARLADGSIGRAKALASSDFQDKRRQALSLLQGLIEFRDQELALEAARSLTGEYAQNRDHLLDLVVIFLALLRDALVLRAGVTVGRLVHGDLQEDIAKLSSFRSCETWTVFVNETLDLMRKIRAHLNLELILTNYFLELVTGN